jgi:outer membrane murein-binding lipoprotein Lpp
MKFVSFKILVLFTLLPPMLFLLTIQALERVFTNRYTIEIEEIAGGDGNALLSGRIRFQDAVAGNVGDFLENSRLRRWGLRIEPTVATEQGKLLYPMYWDGENRPALMPDPAKIAEENFALLQEGLTVTVIVKLKLFAPLALAILVLYGGVAGGALYLYLRGKARHAQREEELRLQEMEALRRKEKASRGSIQTLVADKSRLHQDMARVKDKLEAAQVQANRNEDELFQEIDDLEKKLNDNQRLQESREAEIEELKAELKRLAKDRESVRRQKDKAADALNKRFVTLYKNLDIHPRAVSGLLALPEDMRIKAEEVIHQLDSDPGKITIKRKVFGKKNREPVLEVLFAYNGRLYFRNLKGNRREVVIIGNKNSQSQDLQYIESISRPKSR